MSTQSNKFYTIKEASQLSGLPSSTLRYYESIGIIQSVARDNSSGHRTYTQEDINTIDSIACLSATGMPLEDMRMYLDNWDKGPKEVEVEIRLLKAQERRLKEEQAYIKIRRDYVKLKISYWRAVKNGNTAEVDRIIGEARTLATALKFSKLK